MPKCILCDGNAVISRQENASRTIYNCPYCGVFVISDPVEKEVKANRYKLASFLVNRHLSGSNDIVLISLENTTKDKGYVHMNVEQIVREFPQSVVMRTKLALKNLVNESEYPGAELRIENQSQGPIFYLEHVNFEAMSFAISTLERRELITVSYKGSSFFPCTIVVTPEGWDMVSAMETDTAHQDAALVALSGANDYAPEYVKNATSVCRSNGYRLLEYPCFSGDIKIGHRLFAEIRASRFVICDVSDASPETYFVVGMARALGKTLILTCRTKDRKKLRLDTEHVTVLFWEDMVQLDDELSNAIQALVF
jgi:hypothetical protein